MNTGDGTASGRQPVTLADLMAAVAAAGATCSWFLPMVEIAPAAELVAASFFYGVTHRMIATLRDADRFGLFVQVASTSCLIRATIGWKQWSDDYTWVGSYFLAAVVLPLLVAALVQSKLSSGRLKCRPVALLISTAYGFLGYTAIAFEAMIYAAAVHGYAPPL